jgi:3-oxoadipate enol-lactonase
MSFAQLKNAQVYYEWFELPGRPVIVFSNSLGTTLRMWDVQIDELSKEFGILRYDTRGHGRSSVTPGPYSIEQLARDALELLDILKLQRVYFCGLSMGGMTGMWLAKNAPERLNKLAICSTAAKIGTAEGWNARIAAVEKSGMAAVAAAVIERWFTPAFREKDPASVTTTLKMLEHTNAAGYAANCAAVRDFDFRNALDSIRTPTLVMSGEFDPVAPPSDGQFLASKIPGAQYLDLSGAHISNIEDSVHFTSALRAFFA